MDTPDSPSPRVNDNEADMATEEEDRYLGLHDHNADSSSDDGSQQV